MNTTLIKEIYAKYEALGENPETYLNGLLQSKLITYWDYVEVDTLLSLQKPRTGYADEEIFIMYHQVTELFLKLILHEIKQIIYAEELSLKMLSNKLDRITRYTHMLINSFDIMKVGMDYQDYNTFRSTLTPASGFQSAQFRLIEIYCTPLINLINKEGKERLPNNPKTTDYFNHIYWRDAGLNRTTGAKTITLSLFEEKYLNQFISLADKVKGKTLYERVSSLADCPKEVFDKLREFDYQYNVVWPLVHLDTAKHYLDSKEENQHATGGSEWKKYLHPKFQQRMFFPMFWNESEQSNWGKEVSND